MPTSGDTERANTRSRALTLPDQDEDQEAPYSAGVVGARRVCCSVSGTVTAIGCLATGDEAAEDLFVLAAEAGIENVSIILSPIDFRTQDLPEKMPALPAWSGDLYDAIKEELQKLGRPTSGGTVRRYAPR